MSVFIKGMEMPSSCEKCRFSGFGGLRNERVVCMFTGANAYMNEVQYLDDCPLIPVPPHGRLIDADALVKSIKDQIELIKQFHNDDLDMIAQMIEVGYVQEIANAPTILETEVKE